MEIKCNIPLAEYTSWLVGGPADHFCLPETEEEVKAAWTWALERGLPVTWLGGGTNVLISDKGIRGLTICLRRFVRVHSEQKDGFLFVHCTSGTPKSSVLKEFLKQKLEPALFLSGLPGDVGGGIVMNAGVSENLRPREFGEIVDRFTVLRPRGSAEFEEREYQHDQIRWEYRHSYGWDPGVITRAVLKWPLNPDASILEKVKNANKIRFTKQPLDKPSCGSVFINPENHKSAQLIDSSGLKGTQRGQAQVSLKHANFIVNLGQASAQDIWDLILHVQKTVEDKTGVKLKTEVIRLGEWL